MRFASVFAAACLLACCGIAAAQDRSPRMDRAVMAAAEAERGPLLDTLRELVSIESGSRDAEGLRRIAGVIAARLRALGGEVELVAHDDPYVMVDTPDEIGRTVVGRFRGRGRGRILLLAHMDTVYLRGQLAEQPFRVADGRAYGLGIADDKSGVALVLHLLAALRAIGFDDYELITVLINGDEEVSSAGSRYLITALGAEHDVVFSHEGGGATDRLALTTAGIGAVLLEVTGRASHAGGAPERGRNALYELAHQMLQMRDLTDPEAGIKLNWTLASGGSAPQRDPCQGAGDRRLPRAAGGLVRRGGAARARAGQAPARPRRHGRGVVRAAPAAAGGERRLTGAGGARAVGLPRAGPRVACDGAGSRRRHRRGVSRRSKPMRRSSKGSVRSATARTRTPASTWSSIPWVPRLYLLARMVMDVARGNAGPLRAR